jgi:hypothetical protein
MPADGHTCRIRGGISARPANSTDTISYISSRCLKRGAKYTCSWGNSRHGGRRRRPARRFNDFMWSTRQSWSRQRRVIAKAEWTQGQANPRFIVTSLPAGDGDGRHLYEDVYCARGEMENRAMIDRVVGVLKTRGAEIVDPIEIPNLLGLLQGSGAAPNTKIYETEQAINGYLAQHPDAPVRTFRAMVESPLLIEARRRALIYAVGHVPTEPGFPLQRLTQERSRMRRALAIASSSPSVPSVGTRPAFGAGGSESPSGGPRHEPQAPARYCAGRLGNPKVPFGKSASHGRDCARRLFWLRSTAWRKAQRGHHRGGGQRLLIAAAVCLLPRVNGVLEVGEALPGWLRRFNTMAGRVN